MNAPSKVTLRNSRRQANANTRTVAKNLRTAVRRNGLTLPALLNLAHTNGMSTARLLLALTGLRLDVSQLIVLQRALKLSIHDSFAGTSTQPKTA